MVKVNRRSRDLERVKNRNTSKKPLKKRRGKQNWVVEDGRLNSISREASAE